MSLPAKAAVAPLNFPSVAQFPVDNIDERTARFVLAEDFREVGHPARSLLIAAMWG